MRQVAALLIILTVAGSGCAPTPAPVTVHQAYTRCPRPQRPDLPELDPALHLCAPANFERLLERVDRQCAYSDQQDAALDCYEAQAKKGH